MNHATAKQAEQAQSIKMLDDYLASTRIDALDAELADHDHFNTIERSAGVTAMKIVAGAAITGLALGNGLFEIVLRFIG